MQPITAWFKCNLTCWLFATRRNCCRRTRRIEKHCLMRFPCSMTGKKEKSGGQSGTGRPCTCRYLDRKTGRYQLFDLYRGFTRTLKNQGDRWTQRVQWLKCLFMRHCAPASKIATVSYPPNGTPRRRQCRSVRTRPPHQRPPCVKCMHWSGSRLTRSYSHQFTRP